MISGQNFPGISRANAMQRLEIKSKTTLTKYCFTVGIEAGLYYFTEEEFSKLQQIRAWRLRGGLYRDFVLKTNTQGAA